MKIIRNSAKCLKCGAHITSRHRHDFRYCPCGAIFVDGGTDYLRAGGDLEYYEDTSVVDDTPETGVSSVQDGERRHLQPERADDGVK